MNIYIFSDESGVFDKKHNKFFVFGGVIAIGKDDKYKITRKYSAKERQIRNNNPKYKNKELKAYILEKKHKYELFRLLNHSYKFGVIIDQKSILDGIFDDKKSKQRYLDYAFKIGVKKALIEIIKKENLDINIINELCFYIDEHSTATNGRYELKESLEQEFVKGTFNFNYSRKFPPILSKNAKITLNYYNSKSNYLIRAADIVANKLFNDLRKKPLSEKDKLIITYLP